MQKTHPEAVLPLVSPVTKTCTSQSSERERESGRERERERGKHTPGVREDKHTQRDWDWFSRTASCECGGWQVWNLQGRWPPGHPGRGCGALWSLKTVPFPLKELSVFSSSLQQIGWSTATLWRAFCFVQSLWLNANHISSLCRPGNPGLIIWPSAWVLQPSPVDTKWTSTGVNLGILFTRFPTKLQKSLLVASCRYGNKIHETRHKWKGELLSKNEPPLD